MTPLKNGNWGLKLLALVLAIVIYHALNNETVRAESATHDRHLFR